MSDGAKQSFPDLLVRTSGESRLSDFLLWQSSYSVTHFTNVLWPDFGLNHLMAAIFQYQGKKYYISEILNISSVATHKSATFEDVKNDKRRRIHCFLELLDNSKFSFLKKDNKLKINQSDSRIVGIMNNITDNKGL